MPSRSDRVNIVAARVLFDCAAAGVGLVLLLPFLLAMAIAVKMQDGGAIFYRAMRVGKGGKPFRLYKFRTMVADADRQGALTVQGDPRVTPVGRFLRRNKLDELPQLLNVLKGEMSLVGPRPEDPRFVALYSDEERQVLDCRPGITSIASLRYCREEALLAGRDWEKRYIEEILPHKLSLELEYLRHRNLLSDLRIIIQTLGGITT